MAFEGVPALWDLARDLEQYKLPGIYLAPPLAGVVTDNPVSTPPFALPESGMPALTVYRLAEFPDDDVAGNVTRDVKLTITITPPGGGTFPKEDAFPTL